MSEPLKSNNNNTFNYKRIKKRLNLRKRKKKYRLKYSQPSFLDIIKKV